MSSEILTDKAAFSEFVREKARYFYTVAYRVTLSRESAEDIVQNAFAKLWENRAKIKHDNIIGWVYRVVLNLSIDDRRRLKFAALPEEVAGSDDTAGEAETREESARLHKVLETLPPRQRAAVMLVYFEERPQKEAAELMEINIKALESLLTRAKEKMKEVLDETGKDIPESGHTRTFG